MTAAPEHHHSGDGSDGNGEHTEHEDHGWTVDIKDHPKRTESEGFRRSKDTAHKILAQIRQQDPGGLLATLAGPSGVQAHHAGSLFLFLDGDWFMVLSPAGVEWCAQWGASPEHVDWLRRNAQAVYERFPETLAELTKLGYAEAAQILSEPITGQAGVARWTDSIFNSCVLLSPALHQGIVSTKQQVAGWHHYPKSAWDMQVTAWPDFQVFVVDEHGYEHAVAPVGPRGSGDARVRVVHSHPASPLHAEHMAHEAAGEEHVLEADHPLAQQAFSQQVPA